MCGFFFYYLCGNCFILFFYVKLVPHAKFPHKNDAQMTAWDNDVWKKQQSKSLWGFMMMMMFYDSCNKKKSKKRQTLSLVASLVLAHKMISRYTAHTCTYYCVCKSFSKFLSTADPHCVAHNVSADIMSLQNIKGHYWRLSQREIKGNLCNSDFINTDIPNFVK